MAASTGPRQGVQAKAKAMPITGAAHIPSAAGRTWNRRSRVARPTAPETRAPDPGPEPGRQGTEQEEEAQHHHHHPGERGELLVVGVQHVPEPRGHRPLGPRRPP